MILKRNLPNGRVPTDGIKDQSSRSAFMRVNENVESLHSQLSELQGACQQMERDLKAALAKISVLGSA